MRVKCEPQFVAPHYFIGVDESYRHILCRRHHPLHRGHTRFEILGLREYALGYRPIRCVQPLQIRRGNILIGHGVSAEIGNSDRVVCGVLTSDPLRIDVTGGFFVLRLEVAFCRTVHVSREETRCHSSHEASDHSARMTFDWLPSWATYSARSPDRCAAEPLMRGTPMMYDTRSRRD